MTKRIIQFFLLIYIVLLSTNIFANDKVAFCRKLKIDIDGKVKILQPYQLYLGNYLYGIGNNDVFKLRLREGVVYEYLFQGVLVRFKYNDLGSVYEIREKKKGFPELHHQYKYNKEGYIEKIDHQRISLNKNGQFTKETLGSSHYIYNDKNQLVKKLKKDNKGENYYTHIYEYNNGLISQYRELYKDEVRKLISYENKDGLKLSEKHYYKDHFLFSYHFNYDDKKNIKSIEKKVKGIPFFTDRTKEETALIESKEPIVEVAYETNSLKEIAQVHGILPNIQSYIQYTFAIKPHPLAGNKDTIHANFSCILVKDKSKLNEVTSIMVPSGKRIETKWFNKNGDDVYQQLPEAVRNSQRFSFVNLLSIDNIIIGRLTNELKQDIDREVIVEIYDNKGNRDWCYIHKGYYFYLTQFYDDERQFKQIKVLKAGYQYETKEIQVDHDKTINQIETIVLKLVPSVKP